MRREFLGTAHVDSGQLYIIDPCYIKNDWDAPGNQSYVKFWGQGKEHVVGALKNAGYAVEDMNGAAIVHTDEPDYMTGYIREVARQVDKVVVTSIQTGSNYELACEATGSKKQGGEVDLGVAFSSGLGDGSYDVYATIQDIPGWGERVTKVEIELIPDWELEEMKKQDGKEF